MHARLHNCAAADHTPKAIVASRHWKYSVGFLNGCMAGVFTSPHGGFHFLLSFWPYLFLVLGHAPSVVTSKLPTLATPCQSMHICANKSSPIGPHLVPFTQSIFSLQLSMLSISNLKAFLDMISRFPK